jgi:hypothetical protein
MLPFGLVQRILRLVDGPLPVFTHFLPSFLLTAAARWASGKPEDLSHDDRAYFASREIVEKSGAG